MIGVANVGTNGIYGECGLRRQWGDLLTTQFTVHHGLMGSLLQIRVIRAGNTVVVPVHISESYKDVQSLLVTLLAPPLLNFAISKYVLLFSRVVSSCSCMLTAARKVYRINNIDLLGTSTRIAPYVDWYMRTCGSGIAAEVYAHFEAASVACRLIVQPVVWLSKRWYRAHGSRALQQRLMEARERALRQQELIAAAAARMAAQEEALHGLVIVRVLPCLLLLCPHNQHADVCDIQAFCLVRSPCSRQQEALMCTCPRVTRLDTRLD